MFVHIKNWNTLSYLCFFFLGIPVFFLIIILVDFEGYPSIYLDLIFFLLKFSAIGKIRATDLRVICPNRNLIHLPTELHPWRQKQKWCWLTSCTLFLRSYTLVECQLNWDASVSLWCNTFLFWPFFFLWWLELEVLLD